MGWEKSVGIGLMIAVLTMPGMARAQQKADRPSRESEWYGGQTLAIDGGALALLLLSQKNDAAPTMALAAYVFGGPIVHLAHARPGAALGSLGLRVLTPITFAAVAASTTDCHADEDFCGYAEVILGGLAGAVAASAIDAAVLARRPAEPAPRLAPAVAVSKDQRALLLTGTF